MIIQFIVNYLGTPITLACLSTVGRPNFRRYWMQQIEILLMRLRGCGAERLAEACPVGEHWVG